MSGLVGYHTSSAGGYYKAIERAIEYGLQTFQFFLGSPRTWSYKNLNQSEINKFTKKLDIGNFDTTTVHMNYLPNPCTPEDDVALRTKTLESFEEEIKRSDLLGVDNLVFHIGSHKGNGFDQAKHMVADFIDTGLKCDPNVNLLLETSAGSTNSVGSTFEEIREILNLTKNSEKVGVCFDTCHVFAAGYDLQSKEAVNKTLDEFDQTIGLDRLKVVHANDSKGKLGGGKDRHENIGKGNIGQNGFKELITHPSLDKIPFILETPGKGIVNDIALLKKFSD